MHIANIHAVSNTHVASAMPCLFALEFIEPTNDILCNPTSACKLSRAEITINVCSQVLLTLSRSSCARTSITYLEISEHHIIMGVRLLSQRPGVYMLSRGFEVHRSTPELHLTPSVLGIIILSRASQRQTYRN